MEIPDLLNEVIAKYRRVKEIEAQAALARKELTLAVRKASEADIPFSLIARMLKLSRQRVQGIAEREIDEAEVERAQRAAEIEDLGQNPDYQEWLQRTGYGSGR